MQAGKFFLVGPTESVLTKRGNRFPDFASFLIRKGINIVYYTSDFYHAEKRRFANKEIISAKSVCPYPLHVISVIGYARNVSVRRLISNFIFSIIIFIQFLFRVREKDSILIPSRPVELIFFISLIQRIKRCKIYLDIQDIWPDALQLENQVRKRAFIKYCNFFLNPSLKHFTNTLHVAPSFVKWLNRYAPERPSFFLPLGWENSRWEGSSRVVTKEIRQTQYVLKLVCVAQLTYQFDIMPVLIFLRNQAHYKLTVIGEDGTGERYPEVIKFINKHQIKNVSILGTVPREEMYSYLSNEDIGIVPMISTSIPNKVFDYLGAKLPIIVLGKNDSSDLIDKYGIGWSCDFNAESFGAMVSRISKDDLQKKRQIVERVRIQFSRDHLHEEFYKIITQKCDN